MARPPGLVVIALLLAGCAGLASTPTETVHQTSPPFDPVWTPPQLDRLLLPQESTLERLTLPGPEARKVCTCLAPGERDIVHYWDGRGMEQYVRVWLTVEPEVHLVGGDLHYEGWSGWSPTDPLHLWVEVAADNAEEPYYIKVGAHIQPVAKEDLGKPFEEWDTRGRGTVASLMYELPWPS